MGRPPGSPNRLHQGDPGYKKIGRKSGRTLIERVMPKLRSDEIIEAKLKILELLSSGEATTLSDAARKAGFTPINVYQWGQTDPDFQEMTHLAREVRADALEEKLEDSGNFIPWMFLLKGDRNKYRDNYKAPVEDSKTREIMEKLLELARSGSQPAEEKKDAS